MLTQNELLFLNRVVFDLRQAKSNANMYAAVIKLSIPEQVALTALQIKLSVLVQKSFKAIEVKNANSN